MFAITATRRGDHWKLADQEKDAAGNALANVIRHIPMPEKQVGIAADIAALGFCAYALIVPRIELERRVNALQSGPSETPAPAPVEATYAVEDESSPLAGESGDIVRLPIG